MHDKMGAKRIWSNTKTNSNPLCQKVAMFMVPSRQVLFCLLVLFATPFSGTIFAAGARPIFLVDHSVSNGGLRRMLHGIFGRWEKDDTVPDYSSETTQYGLGGNVKVDKTQVYTDKDYDPSSGATTKVETKLTGSASGKKDVAVDLEYQSEDGLYQGLVASNGKEASGSIDQKYQIDHGDEKFSAQNQLNGLSGGSNEKSGVTIASAVKDCSSGSTDANCAYAGLQMIGEKFSGSLEQNQRYTNEGNGSISSNYNEGSGSTLQPKDGKQESFTATAAGVIRDGPTAVGNTNVAGSAGVSLTGSSVSNTGIGK